MSLIHGHLIYPGVVRLRGEGDVFRFTRELESLQWRAPAELAARQEARLAELLAYAGARVPYYQVHWGRRDGTSGAASHRLARLPFLTKADLQAHRGDLVARAGPRRVTRKTTGGSTGQAVTVLKDRVATAHEMAATWLGYGWFRIKPGDRAARFWGAPTTARRRLRFAAADFAMHRVSFSAFAFSEADLERYWRRCLRLRPAYFYGYVSMLEAFASFVAARGYGPVPWRLKAVVTTSEALTPPQRRLIETAFGAPVQNEYGCGEVGPIAYECEQGSLHVISENLFVELVTPEGRSAEVGESGEVVVTDLNNRAMPLVRYRLGDFAERGADCACGRGFPVLARVWGRAYDFVEAPDGRRYHGEFFMYLFEDLRERGVPVGQFQVTQRGPEEIEVALVPAPTSPADLEGRVLALLRERLPGVHVQARRVGDIPRVGSGKMRIIQNLWRPATIEAAPAVAPTLPA